MKSLISGLIRYFITICFSLIYCSVFMIGLHAKSQISETSKPAKPWNILWISTEDISPDLRCYGDNYALSPNIDKFASEGARWVNAFAVTPVCAPCRSSIITGMYPNSIGSMHMRNKSVPPPEVKCFTEYLRSSGYYCTNNSKTDYQFDVPATAWDESSNKAHWRNRPHKDTPFFSVINFTTTHESQIRLDDDAFAKRTSDLKEAERHDPAKAKLPAYYPDTPVVRNDWARYYDLITVMDKQFAQVLKELDEDGLTDSTVVFFWGDHGRGLPRSKRWPYDSGTRVPLIVRWPGKIGPGLVLDDLVTLMDLGPTVLNIAGVKVPDHMQAKAFMNADGILHDERKYVFAHRDRMDEAYDMIRSARDERFRYIRNFQFHKPYAQHIAYMEEMPTMREWRRLNKEGLLSGPNAYFFLPEKPKEELYDIHADPDEVINLASDPRYREVVKRMRKSVKIWMDEIHDLGFVPEPTLNEQFRPGGVQQITEPLKVEVQNSESSKKFSLSCPTAGASIAWRYKSDPAKSWRVYTKPIESINDEKIIAKACRIGFKDSEIIELN